jgi:O-antigen/teichoic acid export membrane protein
VLGVLLFRPPEEAGYYRIALAVINLMQMPLSPLPQATYPEMARAAARKQWASLREILRKSSLLAGAYSLVLTVGWFSSAASSSTWPTVASLCPPTRRW